MNNCSQQENGCNAACHLSDSKRSLNLCIQCSESCSTLLPNDIAQDTSGLLECELEDECKQGVSDVVNIQPDESVLSVNFDISYADDKPIVFDDSQTHESTPLNNGE